MNLTLAQMAEKLREYKEYRIIYHIRPDGDCIGSAFALALALQSIGAKCEVTGTYPVPNCHREMTDRITMDTLEHPVYIAVDSAAPQRTGDYADTHFTFCIDHHRDNSIAADYKYVEEDCGACSEIIYKLICEMGITVTKQMADLLYTALVTDTMCFRTSDTDVQTFEIAAALAKCGADTFGIARKHMFLKSKGRIEIEKIVQKHFHFTCDGRVLTTTISLKDLEKAGIDDSDLEGINSLVDQVEGVRVGVTIREQPNGKMRCSTRTNGNVAANAICAAHGGGGHEHAACCDLDVSMEEAKTIMEQTAMEFLLAAPSEETNRMAEFAEHPVETAQDYTEVDRKLKSIGKVIFVKYYEMFRDKTREECLAAMEENFTESAKKVRISNAQSIFRAGLERMALERIVNAGKVDEATRLKAKELLAQETSASEVTA